MTGHDRHAGPPKRPVDGDQAVAMAGLLEQAWNSGEAIDPLSDRLEPEDAYAVQRAWTALRERDGETIAGRKIGLTSAAVRRLGGIDEPDYGYLWGSRFFAANGGYSDVPAGVFIAPRVEGEIAFLLGRPLEGGAVTAQQVLVGTEALAVSIEIVDSRIRDWKVRLADTIADNSSYGGFVLGAWSRTLRYRDLGTLATVLHRNGEVVSTGVGVDTLAGPAHAVAWLANKLWTFGESLPVGSIVLSGSLGTAVDARPGDLFTLRLTDQPLLTIRFA